MYFHRAERLGEMGLVRVGDVYGVNPNRRLRIHSRSIWKGSLTTIAVVYPRAFNIDDTAWSDSRVVRPSFSSSMDLSGTPCFRIYPPLTAASLVVSPKPVPPVRIMTRARRLFQRSTAWSRRARNTGDGCPSY